METAINHQSVENLLQNYEDLSIIMAYILSMLDQRIQTRIVFSFVFIFFSSSANLNHWVSLRP
ncbi:hypothetical protein HanRHA438_Chr11g0488441 [Helianthus annuus]|uniref:Uncharacterized protein n=1 Tax=Helianthus annuus TaxID=4232 RepID=A0A251T9K7_HELAN|nr:hypothetical protein HanXRQr2_Chr11g0475041 [Helianthus annuus]KAJ0500447.1 hypothetical protein HanHA300_Chr11g0389651 [Helianthus annuus]KAJ0516310.1 hypothetical protein HanHA89_Chr11g0412481 [Helianthus annuus]KAJ0688267.1 hypothetical protein HanOQP8_Chr11g0392491 [Helianthus annuus]KAJ0869368.1 hypothetical protein HanRHA438_Chr11g0488441 [Helianthus annuus]